MHLHLIIVMTVVASVLAGFVAGCSIAAWLCRIRCPRTVEWCDRCKQWRAREKPPTPKELYELAESIKATAKEIPLER